MGGSWSKWYLALGAIEAHQAILLGVLMVSSLLNIAYLIPIPIRGFFFAPEGDPHPKIKEAPLFCLIPLCLTAVGCLVLFFYAEGVYRLLAPLAGQ
jgi:multicomponent Na+:H+ antiporter subunit D